MSIGEKITMIRGDRSLPNLEVVGKVYGRIDSSPRRFIEEVKGKVPAYADFGNEETNEAIRNNPISKALEDIKAYAVLNEENQAAFADYLSYMHTSWAKSVTPTDADAVRMTQRLFFWLGLKKDDYEITNDGVVFKNWDNLKAALENYKLRTA